MFKVNNKNTVTTPMRCSGVFIVAFAHVLYFFSSVPIADFEQVNIIWKVSPFFTVLFLISTGEQQKGKMVYFCNFFK